jgi:hypothetical protein
LRFTTIARSGGWVIISSVARHRLVARLLLGAVGLGAGWSAGACTRCDVDCAAPSRVEEVVAEVRSSDPGVVHVRTDAGDALEVRLHGGSPDDLEVGTTYRFPLLYLEVEPDPADLAVDPALTDPAVADAALDVQPAAFFPDDCDCTPDYITDLDGEVIDPGVDIPFRRLALAFIAVSLLGTVAWAMVRWYREVPL